MDPWRKETLGLQVGDFIIWQDEAIEVEGQSAVREHHPDGGWADEVAEGLLPAPPASNRGGSSTDLGGSIS